MTNSGTPLPPPPPPPSSNFGLIYVLQRQVLTGGANYLDWMRNLRITLRYDNREYVLDEQIASVDEFSTQEEIAANRKHIDDSNKVSCIMIAAISPELQKTFENMWAYEMTEHLSKLFRQRARQERLTIVKSLMACKLKE